MAAIKIHKFFGSTTTLRINSINY